MLDKSLFVGDGIEEMDVQLADGTTHKMYFKEYSGVTFARYALAAQSKNIEQRSLAMAMLISASVCNPDGTLALTLDQASKLKPEGMTALFAAVLKANHVGQEDQAKNA
jgi:hypothetical protein